MVIPVLGNGSLEFRLVQQEEKPGWDKTEFLGKPIWVSPNCEMDSRYIASAKLTWTGSPWSLLPPDEQVKFRKQHPEITNFDRQPQIFITFTPSGAKRIEELTKKHKGQRLAVIYENKILVAPTIYESINSGSITISGSFTEAEAQNIVSRVNAIIKRQNNRSALVPKQIIYCQSRDGLLFSIGGGSMEKHTLSNHAPLEIPTFKTSPDFRYILHGGTVKAIGRQKLFLYDLQTAAEHLILETPKYDSVQEEFSPDSKTLALMNISIPHRQALENEGLFLIDLETLEQQFFPYPDNAQIPQGNVYGSEIKWSKDGTSIYLAFNGKNPQGGENLREYHRFDVAEKKFHKANGYYKGDLKPNSYGYVFTNDNGPIPVHDNPRPRSHRGGGKVSPDGRWTVEVENRQTLVISEKGGCKKTVDESERCGCGACTIGGINWLDHGRLLIYSTGKRGCCIYNPVTEERGVLFKMNDVGAFTWP